MKRDDVNTYIDDRPEAISSSAGTTGALWRAGKPVLLIPGCFRGIPEAASRYGTGPLMAAKNGLDSTPF